MKRIADAVGFELTEPKQVGWATQCKDVPVDRTKEPPLTQVTGGFTKETHEAVEELNRQYKSKGMLFKLKKD